MHVDSDAWRLWAGGLEAPENCGRAGLDLRSAWLPRLVGEGDLRFGVVWISPEEPPE